MPFVKIYFPEQFCKQTKLEIKASTVKPRAEASVTIQEIRNIFVSDEMLKFSRL